MECYPSVESRVSSSNWARVKEELIRGRELATQLHRVFAADNRSVVSGGVCDVGLAEGHVDKILGSFTNTLFILSDKKSDQDLNSDNQIQVINTSSGAGDWSSRDANHDDHAVKLEDYDQQSCKSTSTFRVRSSDSYKRRKTSQSRTRDTPAWTHDGHEWRKYGQKTILNAKHPRKYYRCTHKFDQACQATKHIQKIQDDPPLFRTTYYDSHTCRDFLKVKDSELLFLACTSPRESSKFISFGNTNNITDIQEHPFFSSTSVKKELIIKEDIPTLTDHRNQSSPRDHLLSPDLTAFNLSGPMNGFSSIIPELDDHEDMISRIMLGSFDFNIDEVLQYEF